MPARYPGPQLIDLNYLNRARVNSSFVGARVRICVIAEVEICLGDENLKLVNCFLIFYSVSDLLT